MILIVRIAVFVQNKTIIQNHFFILANHQVYQTSSGYYIYKKGVLHGIRFHLDI